MFCAYSLYETGFFSYLRINKLIFELWDTIEYFLS